MDSMVGSIPTVARNVNTTDLDRQISFAFEVGKG